MNEMQLATACENRNNNFNLIRFIAATMVLVSHSFPLSYASSEDPLLYLIGITSGNIAVDIFFITSGFLVTRSILVGGNIKIFLLSRAMRIYPGLWVMLIITVFLIGPSLTLISIDSYISDPITWKYFWRNATMLLPSKHELPGLFLDNPYQRAVNGSLWTLPFEIKLYASLALLMWLTKRLNNKYIYFNGFVVFLALTGIGLTILDYFWKLNLSQAIRLSGFFFSGGAFYILRRYIYIKKHYSLAIVPSLILLSSFNQDLFFIVYFLSLTWLIINLAYIPNKTTQMCNRAGDYSYGIYIYAFPVQQTIVFFATNIQPIELAGYSFMLTLPIAVSSWHLIEKPAIKLREKLVTPYVKTSFQNH